ncbi:monocarboxylate transporter 14 isoform X2 [Ranitomeya variabilis]|uniref:monocarboxylate transporter 14 isoform X2 n=1 Tax=Ranitomeya variabilis TaxID=490064 RepID=UPI00405716D0
MVKMCSEGAKMEKKLDGKMKSKVDKPKLDPNIDGGWAWMVVLSSFLVHLLVMGSQMALGILNMEWLEEFDQSRGLTAWVSSLTMGITLIVGPFIGLFINTCGCRKTAMIGGFLTSLGWVLSAFATNVHFLFFTFGVTAGIGSGMVYLPAVVMVGFSSGYFSLMPVVTEDLVGIKQLANAYGIIICANGISALLGPPFAGWIFDITQKYDYSFYVCGLLYMLGIICLLLEPCLQPKKKMSEKPVENHEV